MIDDVQQLFASPDRERLVRDSLLQASTEEDAWEIVEATISYAQAHQDARPWDAIAGHIPAALHQDARTHLTLVTSVSLRQHMEQALPQSN
jgi:hypothetical protein